VYNKENPFHSSIKERYSLCRPGTDKNTQHLVLDLKGSGITYQPGDSIAIIPLNDQDQVTRTLHAMRATGEESIREKNSERVWRLRDFLSQRANLISMSKRFITELCHRQDDLNKKIQLEELLKDGHKQLLANYVEQRHIWDTLLENPEVQFTPEELCHLMMPLLPRFYSISSSMKEVGEEVHLTVAALEYTSNGHLRHGVCTRFLLHTLPLGQPLVPIYVQESHSFTLPKESHIPIIMVGPGTGIAPFRAFIQERLQTGCKGKNWLFFGEWNRDHHFFYEEEWRRVEAMGQLQLDLAFSRDQNHKIYVQHRLLEKGAELFRWLEEGAQFYVCGDADHMAKDVEHALLQIFREQGKLDEAGAKDYLKRLRTEKRYLRDVY
jgi:sulfite reductase (NADPH) flavoprotein alpha-component